MKKIIPYLVLVCLMIECCGCRAIEKAESINTETAQSIYLESVPLISQFPDFPTGCESVSAVMALQYMGENITVDVFIDNYLKTSMDFYNMDGVLYGPDPYQYFIGNPRSTASYGCMAPVIEKALTAYFGSDERIHNKTGADLKNLCEQYVEKGIPVLIWVTIDMKAVTPGKIWVLPSGWAYTWPRGEHCMVLVGYTNTEYVFHDPYTGKMRRFDKTLTASRYAEMGKQAIAII